MTRVNILVCIAVSLVFLSLWAFINRPEIEPPWPEKIQGFSFSPLRPGDNPTTHELPSVEEIDSDLQLLAGKTNAIRTYSVEGTLAQIPSLARKYNLNVTLGAWLGKDLEQNEEQVEGVIRLAKENYRNVIRVIVGNEALLRGDLTMKQLTGYVERVRSALDIPVSTAEPWHIWFKKQELGDHVDFIAAHMLPYWEGTHLDAAVGQVIGHHKLLTRAFPGKPIVIAEVGWPSHGRKRSAASASMVNEATFLRRFLKTAEKLGYTYYIMEAFDQPWKRFDSEGAVGGYWGVYDANREPKFPFTSPLVVIPEWEVLAAISIIIAAIIFMLLVIDSSKLALRGRSFLASIVFVASTGVVWIVYSYTRQYLTPLTILTGLLLILGLTGVVIAILAEAHEWAEASWGAMGRRAPEAVPPDAPLPFVSVHVPTYNEPPEMLKETLDALARLDYPSFEVIVIDNNTRDPGIWRPVEAHCDLLGPRFRFFHEDQLAGFKAGALNYALARTDGQAEVVAVIDSDYVVSKNWLKDLVPFFAHKKIAIVQAPQDYRDDEASLFKAMCFAEYRSFFSIGMVVRNERNAIIQHGTMTMVNRQLLQEIGGWAEWCITEDAELGLRIFENGYEAIYVPKSYGRGLMPDNFVDFKKQRYRWAYGAVQIMRHHLGQLFGRRQGGELTFGQRYHFVAGWIPWFADAVNLIFTLFALAWTVAMIHLPKDVDAPMLMLSIVPLCFFIFKLAKMFYLYHHRVSNSFPQTMASALAGLSLTHTIAKAVLYGLVTRNLPFFRTPKQSGRGSFWYALQAAREETLMATALLLAATIVARVQSDESPDLLVWELVLIIQSIPYLASILLSFIAAFPRLPARFLGRDGMVSPAATVLPTPDTAPPADKRVRSETRKPLFPGAPLSPALLAIPCLMPAALRLSTSGLQEPAGLLSDFTCGMILLAAILLLPRWGRFTLVFLWLLFHLLSLELRYALQRLPVWEDLAYLANPEFLSNSIAGLHFTEPFAALALLFALIPGAFRIRRVRPRTAAACLATGLFLLFLHKPFSASILNSSTSARYNPSHWLGLQTSRDLAHRLQPAEGGGASLPKGLATADLSGTRLLPPQPRGNVLIVTLEGISWLHLASLLEQPPPHSDTYAMEKLAKRLTGAMQVPDFVVHSHQTIRGLYALHCGDFSKLSFETPKAVELQLNPQRASRCLPAILSENHWQTHFLQGANLQFMNKDQAMPTMGFDQVHGYEWFNTKGEKSFIWGAGDEEFFQGARRYITALRKQQQPWLLSLLTVGTHQPFSASEDSVKKHGSRKRAALAELDDAVASFLDWLRDSGVLKDTLVILTSDESQGGVGADWFSSWGFCAVLAPQAKSFPPVLEGTYGLVDLEVSVLDYFGLKIPATVTGRSLFRKYTDSREMVSYTGGKIRYQSGGGELHECSVDGACASYRDARIIGSRTGEKRIESSWGLTELKSLAASLDKSITGAATSKTLNFGHGEIRELPDKIDNEWTDNLIGAQYLNFPAGSTVDVDIDITALAAPKEGIALQLTMRQFEQLVEGVSAPAFPKLETGKSAQVSFTLNNQEARDAFSFHLTGAGIGAKIRIDRFSISIRQ